MAASYDDESMSSLYRMLTAVTDVRPRSTRLFAACQTAATSFLGPV